MARDVLHNKPLLYLSRTLLPKIEYCVRRIEVVYTHITLDQTVMPSRSETDNEVDVHARRAIASRRSDVKIFRQLQRVPLESGDQQIIIRMNGSKAVEKLMIPTWHQCLQYSIALSLPR